MPYPAPSLGSLPWGGFGRGQRTPEIPETLLGLRVHVVFHFSLLCLHISFSLHLPTFTPLVALPPVDSPSHHPEIRRLFPRAQMQTMPNAGHWIHSDSPQDFVTAIRDFLA